MADELLHHLHDARMTLGKMAYGRIGSDNMTLPRSAFDSIMRNIKEAERLATLNKDNRDE
jgi:hypothetical protein